MLSAVTMQSHPVWTSYELLTKIKEFARAQWKLVRGYQATFFMESVFTFLSSRTEQSFSLQQLLMAARNNYGTGHWNRKEANSLPVFSVFLLLYTQLRERLTWVGRRSAHKKVSEKWMVRSHRRKRTPRKYCWLCEMC